MACTSPVLTGTRNHLIAVIDPEMPTQDRNMADNIVTVLLEP
jgi:hypothetical protein